MSHKNLDDIYRSHMPEIFRYLLSLTRDGYWAEDLVQETFVRAYLHIEELDPPRIKPWLFKVAYHVFIDAVRKNKRQIVKDQPFFQQIKGNASTEEEAITRNQLQELEEVLKTLPEKQKHAVLLADFHDLSYKESASIMEVSISYFKVLLFRGRQTLRRLKERSDSADER
ncbi:sigma-70 family RNA polymerase sigma factor [Salinibacillus aidingensis]|uniref:RNA polymerase sigma factor n=1 Tax=Salinibacillus aidingensis TaxID=237684 RepID=A0ABN1B528_9BACI